MQKLLVIPWGKFKHQILPMGLCNSPDIFQNELFNGLEYIRAYIHDLNIIRIGDIKNQLNKVKIVLKKLNAAGFKINSNILFSARDNLEYVNLKYLDKV